MTAPTDAPRLVLDAPAAWTRQDGAETDWWADAPAERPLGVLATALHLEGRLEGEPIRAAASVVVTRLPASPTDDEVQSSAEPRSELLASGWVDLPAGRSFRTQLLRDGPATSGGAAGPHATVRYVIPTRDRWLVTLTFDTSTVHWLIPLVEAFDEIALRASWAD